MTINFMCNERTSRTPFPQDVGQSFGRQMMYAFREVIYPNVSSFYTMISILMVLLEIIRLSLGTQVQVSGTTLGPEFIRREGQGKLC